MTDLERRAALKVVSRVSDPEQARELLQALGLMKPGPRRHRSTYGRGMRLGPRVKPCDSPAPVVVQHEGLTADDLDWMRENGYLRPIAEVAA